MQLLWIMSSTICQIRNGNAMASKVPSNINFSLIHDFLIPTASRPLSITVNCIKPNDSSSFSGKCQFLLRIVWSWSVVTSFSLELTLPNPVLLFFRFTGPKILMSLQDEHLAPAWYVIIMESLVFPRKRLTEPYFLPSRGQSLEHLPLGHARSHGR